MDLILKTANEPPPNKAGRDLSALVICEYETAAHAFEVLQQLRRTLKVEAGRLIYQSLNLDVLAFTDYHESSAAEAAAADLVLVGIHTESQLATLVIPWVNRWLTLRSARSGVLLILLDSKLPATATTLGLISKLEMAATAGKMDFFLTRTSAAVDLSSVRQTCEAVRKIILERHILLQHSAAEPKAAARL